MCGGTDIDGFCLLFLQERGTGRDRTQTEGANGLFCLPFIFDSFFAVLIGDMLAEMNWWLMAWDLNPAWKGVTAALRKLRASLR